jgi:hypothetical protein
MNNAKTHPISTQAGGDFGMRHGCINIVGIKVYIDWGDLSIIKRIGTPGRYDPQQQLKDVADALKQNGFTIFWCLDRSQVHIFLPEDQEDEAYKIIIRAIRTSDSYSQNGQLIKYQPDKNVLGSPICHADDCELTALYLPALKKNLVKIVEHQNRNRGTVIAPNQNIQGSVGRMGGVSN